MLCTASPIDLFAAEDTLEYAVQIKRTKRVAEQRNACAQADSAIPLFDNPRSDSGLAECDCKRQPTNPTPDD